MDGYQIINTVIILSFWTDRPGQSRSRSDCYWSDQVLLSLLFRLHVLDSLLYGRATLFKF